MKCPNCGKEIANDSNFCEYCGTKLTKPVNRKKVLWTILTALIALCMAGGIVKIVLNQQEKSAQNKDFTETAYGINMKMIWVEGGDFLMGCTTEQGDDCDSDEKNVRYVSVDGFYIGMLEVTQSQWEKVMGTSIYQQWTKAGNNDNPTKGVGGDYPMYYVSWEEATEFCRILSNKTGKTYTLPTEAQWEYAARGGKRQDGTVYAGSNKMKAVGWYAKNSNGTSHPCGKKRANGLGIYDMSGNVWEWCKDWYSKNYASDDTKNPTGSLSGNYRVDRGGSWRSMDAHYCRVSNRYSGTPEHRYDDLGFRVVCIPKGVNGLKDIMEQDTESSALRTDSLTKRNGQQLFIGPFSISSSTMVKFSPGNLQYCADTKEWRFADNQWDYVGDATHGTVYEKGVKSDNSKISSTYNGWIDLFGWGTSGWDNGANEYQPYSIRNDNESYYIGGNESNDLIGEYAKADWGVYNTIKNGSVIYSAGTWRTPTKNEWVYLFRKRKNAAQLFGFGTVNGVRGIIVLPDNWGHPTDIIFTPSTDKGLSWQNDEYKAEDYNHNHFSDNTYTLDQWNIMESYGALFLPAAGYRMGSHLDMHFPYGCYWSSTHSSYDAYFLDFCTCEVCKDPWDILSPHAAGWRGHGNSVRLIREINPQNYKGGKN